MLEIDMSALPAPQSIDEPAFETIFNERCQALIGACPNSIKDMIAATLALESDPLAIHLQQEAYRELLLRQKINERTRATMLAFASAADLDHFAASRGLVRKVIQEANDTVNPAIVEILESDADLRRRIQLHPESYAAAAPIAAYKSHALDANNDVADAFIHSPIPGDVNVYIKSYSNDGISSANLLTSVASYLSAEERRPLCDHVTVLAATAKPIVIQWRNTYDKGPDKSVVQAAQNQAIENLIREHAYIKAEVALSKIYGALDVNGVQKVTLVSPTSDVVCAIGEFPRFTLEASS